MPTVTRFPLSGQDFLASHPQTFQNENIGNFVASGLTPSAGTGLTLNIATGICYISGIRHSISADSVTMNASTTNYVFYDGDTQNWHVDTDNTPPTNYVRIAKVTTGASSITSIVDLRPTIVAVVTPIKLTKDSRTFQFRGLTNFSRSTTFAPPGGYAIAIFPKVMIDDVLYAYPPGLRCTIAVDKTYSCLDGTNLGDILIYSITYINRAYAKTTTPNYPNVNDADPNTYQGFSFTEATYTERVRIDLGSTYNIARISYRISLWGDSTVTTAYARVEYSVDGSSWISGPEHSKTGTSAATFDNNWDISASMRYIRVVSKQSGGTGNMNVFDIAAWSL